MRAFVRFLASRISSSICSLPEQMETNRRTWQGAQKFAEFAICEVFASNKNASRVRRIKMLFAKCEVFMFFFTQS